MPVSNYNHFTGKKPKAAKNRAKNPRRKHTHVNKYQNKPKEIEVIKEV